MTADEPFLADPTGHVRRWLDNNRRAVYFAGAALLVAYYAGWIPESPLPSWWPVALVAIGAAGAAGHVAAGKVLDLLPDPEGILLVEFKASDAGGGAIYELSEDRFADMRVVGSLYQWDRSPRRVYEVREYDREHNVAVGNWRETVPASELAEPPTVDDALAAIRELREDLEPDVAKARETRRRLRGIVRRLDKDRAEAQQKLLDNHVAPDLGDSEPISQVVDEMVPEELHPEQVAVEDAVAEAAEADERHDNGDSPSEGREVPNMAEMELWPTAGGNGDE